MKKYAFWLVFLSLLAVTGFMIITTTFQPLDSLMKPPKVDGENLSVQLAFEEEVGTDYILKRPIKGNYKNAYTYIDLTGDKNNEVIVFYSKADNLGIVRMNVLINNDGQWESIADFQSVHYDILEVDFADLNGDGNKEIIVGWTVFEDSFSKTIRIYEVSQEYNSYKIYPIYGNNYSMFKVLDVDSNGIDDLLTVRYAAAAGSTVYTASFLSYENRQIIEKASFILDRSINSIGAINCDYLDGNRQARIFVDGYKTDGGMLTDCFVWNSENSSFARCFVSGNSISSLTARTSAVFCKDVNSDGYIEVPMEDFLPNISDNKQIADNYSSGTGIITWLWFNGNESELVGSHIILSQYGYSFRFKQSWFGNISVENNTENSTLTFWSIKHENGTAVKDKKLFSIMTLTELDLEFISELSFNYTLIDLGKDKFYYCRIFDDGLEYGITRKDIKSRIILV